MNKETYYNQKQIELVKECEEPYRNGLNPRKTKISGYITEKLLLEFLKEEFKGKLLFKQGDIFVGNDDSLPCKAYTRKLYSSQGEELTRRLYVNANGKIDVNGMIKEKLKVLKINNKDEFLELQTKKNNKHIPQSDIIVYENDEDYWERADGNAMIPYSKVKLIIEVKKKDTLSKKNDIKVNQIEKLVRYYNTIPILFVSFRGTGDKKRFEQTIRDYANERTDIRVFMLSKQMEKDGAQEKLIEKGEVEPIARIANFEGKLEELVESIEQLIT